MQEVRLLTLGTKPLERGMLPHHWGCAMLPRQSTAILKAARSFLERLSRPEAQITKTATLAMRARRSPEHWQEKSCREDSKRQCSGHCLLAELGQETPRRVPARSFAPRLIRPGDTR